MWSKLAVTPMPSCFPRSSLKQSFFSFICFNLSLGKYKVKAGPQELKEIETLPGNINRLEHTLTGQEQLRIKDQRSYEK